jgi:SAM-dependent methyltransferase
MPASTPDDLAARLALPAYPRSARYDPQWQVDTMMGPNVLWLTESVMSRMRLQPGMRVLDLGCGMASSSIFLAREFGVQVWATDLWIGATDNLARIREHGAEDQVFPIHAEAHTLPYADGFFDAIVSIDAYQYFGTSETYTATTLRLLKPGGEFGLVVPGLVEELDAVPGHLAPYWEPDFWSFHSAAWWRRHLERTGPFDVTYAGDIPDAIAQWLHWERIVAEVGYPPHFPHSEKDIPFLEDDMGRALALVEVVARKP